MSITTQQFFVSAWITIAPIVAALAGAAVFIRNAFTVRKLRTEIEKLQGKAEGRASRDGLPTVEELRRLNFRNQMTIGALVLLFVGLAIGSSRVRHSLRQAEAESAQSVGRAKVEGFRQAEIMAAEKERRRLLVLREQIRRLEAENATLRKKPPQPSPTEAEADADEVQSTGTRF